MVMLNPQPEHIQRNSAYGEFTTPDHNVWLSIDDPFGGDGVRLPFLVAEKAGRGFRTPRARPRRMEPAFWRTSSA